jgi:hypothetical protein
MKNLKWYINDSTKNLLRFTSLKTLVAEVKSYGITVEIPGKVSPLRMIGLDKIKYVDRLQSKTFFLTQQHSWTTSSLAKLRMPA